MLFPSSHPVLVGGRTIVAIVPIGLQPIIDTTVPQHGNYKAAGVFHKNTGKTKGGAYESALHLTGEYPDWWPGHRFARPIKAWCCGKTFVKVFEIVQTELLGDVETGARKTMSGTGMVPLDRIDQRSLTWRQGVSNLVDTVRIKHVGGWSRLSFKAYSEGRDAFEGTAIDWIWDDEEPPQDVYGEQLIRLGTTRGRSLLTFTPLEGMSDVVMGFVPKEEEAA